MENLIKELREKHLQHNIDLTSFKPEDVAFLEIAFDAGARCMYNQLKQCAVAKPTNENGALPVADVSNSKICPSHKPLYLRYLEWHEEAEKRHRKGMKQKQCPECKRWLWKDEM
jgi:hypothetical protein